MNLLLIEDDDKTASSVSQYWYYPSSEAPYRNNIFMSGPDVLALERAGYVIGHELGHILTNHGHADEVWRLMFPRVKINGVIGSRRFVAEEEIQIQGSPHVQEQ